MKYSDQNPPLQCFMNQSSWAKGAVKNGTPIGILWHDTAAGNPNLERYVQPDDDAPNRDELIALLGKNPYNNDWNHQAVNAGLNCWVGKLADGTVTTMQAGPWTTHAWGCGGGTRGSCNGYVKSNGQTITTPEFWIQFEICDDAGRRAVTYYDEKAGAETTTYVLDYSLGKKEYFEAVYQEACEITAYLCKKFNIDPFGSIDYAGVKVPTILCHKDSSDLKLGSAHGDVLAWFSVYGRTMNDVRNDVAKLLGQQPVPTPTFKIGDQVYIKPGVTTFANKAEMQSWVPTYKPFYVRGLTTDKAVISTVQTGPITGTVWQKDIALIEEPKAFKIGDKVKFNASATQWVNKATIPQWVKDWDPLYVRNIREDGTQILISTMEVGDITGWAWAKDLEYSEKTEDVTVQPEKPEIIPVYKYKVEWFSEMNVRSEINEDEVLYDVTESELAAKFTTNGYLCDAISCDTDGNIYYHNALTHRNIWVYDYQSSWIDKAFQTIMMEDDPEVVFEDDNWYCFYDDNALYPDYLDDKKDDEKPDPAPDPQPEPSPEPQPDPEPLPWLKRILIAILHALQKIFSKPSK